MQGSRFRGALALVTALSMAFPALQAQASAPTRASATDHAPASVLGLDADQTAVGARLTQALRRAFAARGLAGGQEAELSELRLALGCASGGAACLARGGELLEARRLIYGSLRREGDERWALDLSVLEAESATIAAHQTFALTGFDLEPANVDATADRVAVGLLPDEVEPSRPGESTGSMSPPPPPPPPPDVAPTPVDYSEDEDEGPKDGLIWGRYQPRPRWKWIGFGVSAGVAVVGFAGTLGTGLYLTASDTSGRGFRGELLSAASATQAKLGGETFDLNNEAHFGVVPVDLPPTVNLCDYNTHEYFVDGNSNFTQGEPIIAPDGGQGVRDAEVGQVCRKGQNVRTMQLAFAAVMGVGLVSTVVFTTLLFVHRGPKSKVAQTWKRRELSVGLGPSRGRGAALTLGGRF